MKQTIIEEIKRIEAAEEVTIWYAVESGSRAWGFPSQDSDYDVRFIYTRKPEWYLSVQERRDVIEYPIDDLLDVSGWDLKKALMLLRKSNPSLIEWLLSPIVYQKKGKLAEELLAMVREHISLRGLIYHYLHMARGNYRDYLRQDHVKIKKYFYVLRPIFACMYIETYGTEPPILFSELLAQPNIPVEVVNEVNSLLNRKLAGDELDWEPRSDILNAFITSQIAYFEEAVSAVDCGKPVGYDKLNDLFRRYVNQSATN
ncbi:nucleotidyltransferase domain-containing protein [Vagococcus sp. BWB3-3]|uniref:Nucleotidyltransferase domain-containing protein n=1 Tax=Vagococcus allomyrinae TaxID=2794353 RepID=A0A940P2B1_9ENTE|nr:nucleotidyltransferase domain-containing protein [Vagococcus allomyrinae]MBP1039740.1 nucleotidyltransferase domain-containing protein [Vagococcus allomyrinae]